MSYLFSHKEDSCLLTTHRRLYVTVPQLVDQKGQMQASHTDVNKWWPAKPPSPTPSWPCQAFSLPLLFVSLLTFLYTAFLPPRLSLCQQLGTKASARVCGKHWCSSSLGKMFVSFFANSDLSRILDAKCSANSRRYKALRPVITCWVSALYNGRLIDSFLLLCLCLCADLRKTCSSPRSNGQWPLSLPPGLPVSACCESAFLSVSNSTIPRHLYLLCSSSLSLSHTQAGLFFYCY